MVAFLANQPRDPHPKVEGRQGIRLLGEGRVQFAWTEGAAKHAPEEQPQRPTARR